MIEHLLSDWSDDVTNAARYLDELQFVALDMYAVVRADYFVGILSSSFSMAVCGMRGGEGASRSNICEAHFGICRAL